MGYSANAGWLVSLQYDFLNQSQLRNGRHAVSPAQVAAINDAGGSQEVENGTINRYTTLGVSYAPNPEWNLKLTLPYVDRSHSTYGASTNPLLSTDLSAGTVSGLGDMRFVASYQGFLPTHNLGLQLGLKLPTGAYGGANADGTGSVGRNPAAFSSGPASQQGPGANLIDASLQTGTGSTDLIVGAYYYQAVSQNFDAFINGQLQAAVAHKLNQPGADYRPGNQGTLSFGLRYEADPRLVPQLQVNLTRKNSDQGALADTGNTAGTVAYLSPGVTAAVDDHTHVYAFVQLPVVSRLQGYQLFPRWTATVGLSHAF